MTPKPYIAVAGLGRCGTTMVMHMLYAAGVPCIGERPSFEVDETNCRPVAAEFLARFPGHAFKLLDPHHAPLPPGLAPAVLIWLDRDPVEQAKSQAKFATTLIGLPRPSRAHMRRWAAGLRRDRAAAIAPFHSWPKLVLRFERIIYAPHVSAISIARFLQPYWPGLDAGRMASVVRPRRSECAPALDIELELLAEAEGGRA